MTTVKDLRDGDKKVDIVGTIVEVGSSREAAGSTVTDTVLKDATGQIKLPLWGADADKVMVGSEVSVEKGYVTTFRGEKQLNVGKYGTFTVLGAKPKASEAKQDTLKSEVKSGPNFAHYYYGVRELQEVDLTGANQLLKQGWMLEGTKEKHVSVPTPEGLSHESSVVYILSRRFD